MGRLGDCAFSLISLPCTPRVKGGRKTTDLPIGQ